MIAASRVKGVAEAPSAFEIDAGEGSVDTDIDN